MRRSLLIGPIVLAVLMTAEPRATPAAPQALARDAQASAPRGGTGRIRGRVIVADTGQPVRRADVELMSLDAIDRRSTTSDAEGRFEFANLSAGRFRLMASKSTFLAGRYGSRGPDDASSRTIGLSDGQAIDDADIRLSHGGVIAGRVVDEFGDAVADLTVSVLRYETFGVSRQLALGGPSQRTSDLGQFRIYNLPPGTYYVAAGSPDAWQAAPPAADRTGYARTYFPGSVDLAQAQSIRVQAGQIVTDADIVMTPVRFARISGVIVDGRGRPVPNTSLTALVMTGGVVGFGAGAAVTRPDGTFVLPNVGPGEYVLTCRTFPPGPPAAGDGEPREEYALAHVNVSGEDVTGVVLQLTHGGSVTGRVVFEGDTAGRAALNVTVEAQQAEPVDILGMGYVRQLVNTDGTFSLKGLMGSRLLRVTGQPPGWALKAIYVNDRDVADSPIAFEGREDLREVRVVFTDRITRVTGTVVSDDGTPAAGAYVIVLSTDPVRWDLRSRYQARTTCTGTAPFTIEGLPPGDYFAVAVEDPRTAVDLLDEDVVTRLRKAGTTFSLKEGETRSVTLKLVAGQ